MGGVCSIYGKERNVNKIVVGKHEGKGTLGGPRR